MRLGCDPEIFLQDAAGALVAVCGKIGGTKDAPRPLEPLGAGYAVQEDNVALEFNIPPANSSNEFVKNVSAARSFLSEMVQYQGLAFSKLSAALFPDDELIDPKALEFGCDPDFNAWTNGGVNPKPKADDHRLRSCGGHVHVGHNFYSRADAFNFIKYMDLYLGVPSVLMDKGSLRKKLYGKSGACRIKTYGVEYRTLSNFWVFDDKLIEWVWHQTEAAMNAWIHNNEKLFALEAHNIQKAIDENNEDVAFYLIDKYELQVVHA